MTKGQACRPALTHKSGLAQGESLASQSARNFTKSIECRVIRGILSELGHVLYRADYVVAKAGRFPMRAAALRAAKTTNIGVI